MTDNLGDRMKLYEDMECGRILMPHLSIYARLDGKCFSRFTQKMDRPYDLRMSRLMVAVTKFLVEETSAVIGYTQSDEISLAWYYPNPKSEPLFGGRIQKINSTLAGLASAKFALLAAQVFDGDAVPSFDCRVFNLPNLEECANAFLWRELDATKNAVTMLAQAYFSHEQLHEKSGAEKQEMLFQQHGINFNDQPAFFKRGTFVRRIFEEKPISTERMASIPEEFRPVNPPVRPRIVELDMPPFMKVTNRSGVIFAGEQPTTAEQQQ